MGRARAADVGRTVAVGIDVERRVVEVARHEPRPEAQPAAGLDQQQRVIAAGAGAARERLVRGLRALGVARLVAQRLADGMAHVHQQQARVGPHLNREEGPHPLEQAPLGIGVARLEQHPQFAALVVRVVEGPAPRVLGDQRRHGWQAVVAHGEARADLQVIGLGQGRDHCDRIGLHVVHPFDARLGSHRDVGPQHLDVVAGARPEQQSVRPEAHRLRIAVGGRVLDFETNAHVTPRARSASEVKASA